MVLFAVATCSYFKQQQFPCLTRHSVLVNKLSQLEILDCFFNWLIELFIGPKSFNPLHWTILAPIIHGSGLGPLKFMVIVFTLHPVGAKNRIVKFADET